MDAEQIIANATSNPSSTACKAAIDISYVFEQTFAILEQITPQEGAKRAVKDGAAVALIIQQAIDTAIRDAAE